MERESCATDGSEENIKYGNDLSLNRAQTWELGNNLTSSNGEDIQLRRFVSDSDATYTSPCPRRALPFMNENLICQQEFASELATLKDLDHVRYNRWLKMSSWVASLKHDKHNEIQLGSAILIGPNVIVTNRHIGAARFPHETLYAVFTDYQDAECPTYGYHVHDIDPEKYREIAEKLGVNMINEQDDVLLFHIEKSNDQFPISYCTFCPVRNRDVSNLSLTYLGFNPTKETLHISCASGRVLSPKKMMQKNIDFSNEFLVWGDMKTTATVQSQVVFQNSNLESETIITDDCEESVHNSVNPPSREVRLNATLTTDKLAKVAIGLTEENYKLYYNSFVTELDTLFVHRHILVGHDHAIVGHKTSNGSCGGGYWDESYEPVEQSFFGIHAGVVKPEILISDPDHNFENHLVLRIDSESCTPFIREFVDPEGRYPNVDEIRDFQRYLGKKVFIENTRISGLLGEFSEDGEGEDKIFNLMVFKSLSSKWDDTHFQVSRKVGERIVTITSHTLEQNSFLRLDSVHDAKSVKFDSSVSWDNSSDLKAEYDEKVEVKGLCGSIALVSKQMNNNNIQCIFKSALDYMKEEGYDEATSEYEKVKEFEELINTGQVNHTQMTNGPRNSKILPNCTIHGHTGKSVEVNGSHDKELKRAAQQARNTDVKLYVDGRKRIVYQLRGSKLFFNELLSKYADHN